MSLDKNDIEIEERLYRYFKGELSPDEKEGVESWRTASAENQELFDEVRINYLDLKGLAYYKNTPTPADQSWENFRYRNNIPITSSPSFGWVRYAASIAIVCTVALVVYLFRGREEAILQTSGDEVLNLKLPDHSVIALNKGATLDYSQPFPNKERRVKLKGDAYFDVAKNPEMPFIVQAGNAEVRVLGTRFFVQQAANRLQVNVEEGKVLVSYQDVHEIIAAGESLDLNLATHEIRTAEDETGLSTFWKSKKLVFNVTSLEEVISTVSQAYETEILLDGNGEGCSLTVTFENESLENVLEVISSTLNYQVVDGRDSYTLKGDGCE